MIDLFFATLQAKTFAILSFAFFLTYLAARGIIEYFRHAAERGSSYVSVIVNEEGEQDLVPARHLVQKIIWPLLILNVIAFVFLLASESLEIRLFSFFIFALTEGLTIGLILLSMNERLGARVLLLTALTTFVAGFIVYYGNFDFSWLGNYLFFALLVLFVITIARVTFRIKGFKHRLIAFFGVLIFIGYLLYDFSALKVARGTESLNNWASALDFSTSIYLDVINLFLQLLDALSGE